MTGIALHSVKCVRSNEGLLMFFFLIYLANLTPKVTQQAHETLK